MTALHWRTVTAHMRRVLEVVGRSDLVPDFYLAGGSALALQLGHRQSVDLDFFSETDEVRPEMHSLRSQAAHVLRSFDPEIVEQAWGNLVVGIQGCLRVGFFGYGYRLVAPPLLAVGVPLASLVDIGLMKLDALATRASRRDFYDLYALAEHVSFRQLFDRAPEKYPSVRDFEAMVVRRMVYFERAEQEEMPLLLRPVGWETVMAFFREQAVALGNAWQE